MSIELETAMIDSSNKWKRQKRDKIFRNSTDFALEISTENHRNYTGIGTVTTLVQKVSVNTYLGRQDKAMYSTHSLQSPRPCSRVQ